MEFHIRDFRINDLYLFVVCTFIFVSFMISKIVIAYLYWGWEAISDSDEKELIFCFFVVALWDMWAGRKFWETSKPANFLGPI